MSKKALSVLGRYLLKGVGNGFVELFLGSGFGTAQTVFDFAPHQFDWVEIWTVRGLVMQFDTRVGKQFLSCFRFVCGQIIHYHDGICGKFGNQHLRDIGFEGKSIHRAIKHHRRDGGFPRDGRDQGGRIPVSMRRVIEDTLTF